MIRDILCPKCKHAIRTTITPGEKITCQHCGATLRCKKKITQETDAAPTIQKNNTIRGDTANTPQAEATQNKPASSKAEQVTASLEVDKLSSVAQETAEQNQSLPDDPASPEQSWKIPALIIMLAILCWTVVGGLLYLGLHYLVLCYAFPVWITGVLVLFPGILRGIAQSFYHVMGYSYPGLFGDPEDRLNLGVLPVALLQALVFSLITGNFIQEFPFILIVALGGIFAIIQASIRSLSGGILRNVGVLVSNAVIGGAAGGIVGGMSPMLIGGIIGGIIGGVEIYMSKESFLGKPVKFSSLWLGICLLGGSIADLDSTIAISVIVVGLIPVFDKIVSFIIHSIAKVVSWIVSPVVILFHAKTILCDHCLQYTEAFKSRYEKGRRHCQHCDNTVERTHEPGKIVVTFGQILPPLTGRVFFLVDPNFEQETFPLEIAEVHLDAKSCDKRLVERFVTYIINYPPTHGVQSVQIRYQGPLDTLGGNLKNALQNTFTDVEALLSEHREQVLQHKGFGTQLVQCPKDPHHFYSQPRQHCPWCERNNFLESLREAQKHQEEVVFQVRPWVRYIARSLDFFLFGLFFGTLVSLSFAMFVSADPNKWSLSPGTRILLMILFPPFAIIFESLLLVLLGTTPGKWLFNTHVRTQEGEKLTSSEALGRTISVWLLGLALGIPVITLITQWKAYKRLISSGKTLWDDSGGFVVIHEKATRAAVLVGIIAVLAFTAATLPILQELKAFQQVQAIKQLQHSESPSQKEEAVQILGRIGDRWAVPFLITTLTDSKDLNLRAAAAQALGNIGDDRAIEPLIVALKDTDVDFRKAAVQALEAIGDHRAVEPLTVTLKDGDVEVRKAAVHALGTIGDHQTVEPLTTALRDGDAEVRKAVVHALGTIGSHQIITPLTIALQDEDIEVRKAAVHVLGSIGDEQIIKPLTITLNDESAEVRKAGVKTLITLGWTPTSESEKVLYYVEKQEWNECVKIGEPAVEPLLAILQEKSLSVRENVVEVLGKIGDSRAVEPLIAMLRDKDVKSRNAREAIVQALESIGDSRAIAPLSEVLKKDFSDSVKKAAAAALGKIGGKQAVEPLIATLKNERSDVRQAAIEALGKIGDSQALTPLNEALKAESPSSYLRAIIVKALSKIGGKQSVEALIAALEDDNRYARRAAAEALDKLGWKPTNEREKALFLIAQGKLSECVEMGEAAIDPLLVSLKRKDGWNRTGAAIALRQIGGDRVIKSLITALKDKNSSVREAAAHVLGESNDRRAIEPLIELLKDKSWPVREAVAFALGKLGDPRAVEPLNDTLKDEHRSVRSAVAFALGKLGDPRSIESLIVALTDEESFVRKNAISALGRLGDRRAVEPLIVAFKNEKFSLREIVAQALGNIGDHRAIEPLRAALNDEDRDVREAVQKALEQIQNQQ